MKRFSHIQIATLLGISALILPAVVTAQNTLALEEVIVTATKRASSLQDVAVAVTALSESALKDAQISSSEELSALVPSLNLQRGAAPRGSSFNIRGIGTQSFSSGVEPSVSTVVDGVVMGRSGMAFMSLLDVQRVEVLRGPQGTLFGKNSSGGVVHIISQDPSDTFEAEVSATAIERGEYRAGFTVANAISDTLGFRLTGAYTDDEGWMDNLYSGDKVNDTESWSLRGKLRWTPTDTLEIKWSSDANDTDTTCCQNAYLSIDPWATATAGQIASQQTVLDELLPIVPFAENMATNTDGNNFKDINGSGHSLEINWDIGEHTLTSITAFRDWEQENAEDADGRPTTLLVEQIGFSTQEQFTQELRLTSPYDQFASYVLGLYYFDQALERRFQRTLFPADPAIAGTALSMGEVDTLNYAAFSEVTFALRDNLRLIAGARYTHDELEFKFNRASDSPFQPVIPLFGDNLEEDDTSFKLSLNWDATDSMLAYISFAQGYKGPAYNITSGSTPTSTVPVDPETADAYELGLKSSWFDNRLVLNVALFHADYKNFQAQNVEAVLILDDNGNPRDLDGNGIQDTAFSFVLNNVGEVSTRGLEIDFMARPTENLTLSGGVAFIDAEIEEYRGGPCSFAQETRGVGYQGQTTCGLTVPAGQPRNQDLSGGELPNSPDWKLNVAANYTIPLANAPFDVVLKANYRIQDDVQYGIQQDKMTIEDGYDILDLSVVLRDKDEHYTVTAFVKNALDDFYHTSLTSQTDSIVPNGYLLRAPKTARRTAGVEVRYNWF